MNAILYYIAKHWKWFASAAFVLAMLIGIQLYKSQRDEARQQFEIAEAKRNETLARLAISNASIAALNSEVDKQNGAIDQLSKDSDARLLEGRALILAEVKKGSQAAVVAAKLSAKPQVGGDQSKTSEAIIGAKELL